MALVNVEAHRWTRQEYDRLVERGLLPAGKRVELVEGVIYDMTPQNSLHATGFRKVQQALGVSLPARLRFRDSRPAPPCPE